MKFQTTFGKSNFLKDSSESNQGPFDLHGSFIYAFNDYVGRGKLSIHLLLFFLCGSVKNIFPFLGQTLSPSHISSYLLTHTPINTRMCTWVVL